VWFANVPRAETSPAERAATSDQQWKQQLLELFAGDRGPATDLIAAGRLEIAGDNTYDLPAVPTWHTDRMAIIGDAAHAPSPSSGQGASLAAEDAVVLAKALRDQPAVDQALAAYERQRRDRVEKIVAEAARASSSKAPGPAGRVLQGIMLPLVFKFLVTDKSLAWRYDHHLDWAGASASAGKSTITAHIPVINSD
jgi:2-polyprenyl-6-methoxyphenol hydroxylase-like FAD-dependent oxidoreductase